MKGASWQIYCTRFHSPLSITMRFRLRHLSFALLGSLGCTAAAERTSQRSTDGIAAGTVVAVDTVSASAVRALYVNRWASQSRKRMAKLIAIADTTEINALVIDMK